MHLYFFIGACNNYTFYINTNFLDSNQSKCKKNAVCNRKSKNLFHHPLIIIMTRFMVIKNPYWERSGSVVEFLTQDQGAAGSSLTGPALSLSKNINPNLVLVQPRKTRPYITERLLMGRKESNQTNKNSLL